MRTFNHGKFLQAALLVLLNAACAYRFTRSSELALRDAPRVEGKTQRIFIPVMDNITDRPGIEIYFSNELRRQLSMLEGVEIVSSATDADYVLLSTLKKFETQTGPTSVVGTLDSEREGGLAKSQLQAQSATLVMDFHLGFLQQVKPEIEGAKGYKKLLWDREISMRQDYDTSNRLSELQGASSAPHINASRELIVVQAIAGAFAGQVLDQLTYNF